MRITIVGSGGVGGYFGARLAQGGCDVGFVARGAHLAAMREHGLRVKSQLGDFHLPRVRVSNDPAALGEADFVFICVKLWDTEPALRAAAAVAGSRTTFVSFQNGVQKDDLLRSIVGEKPAIGGVGYIGSKIGSPGVISHTGTMQRLVFGEYSGAKSHRVVELHQACIRGGIDAEISTDIRRAIWEKFVFLVGLSGVTTSTHSMLGQILHNSNTRAFLLDVMREVVAVGRAHGVSLPDNFAETRLTFCDSLPPDMDSSMHADFEKGNRLEIDWLSGAVVELGKSVNVPTPMNRAIRDILSLHASGKQSIA
jgi:2-dehydropantoate 2-reductase